MNTNKTILITGGLGYVGGRLAFYLKEFRQDMNIIVTTRRTLNNFPLWASEVTVRRMDILDDDSIRAALKDVHVVVHLAAVNEVESQIDPEKALLVNCLGTWKLLKAAEHEGIQRFIYFSTAHVYGPPLSGVISESTPTHPIHPYAITHRAAEDLVFASNVQKKLLGVVLRLSNSFGAPVDASVNRWTLVTNDLCRQVVTTGKIVLRSSGLEVRDFIPLEDVCRCVNYFIELSSEKCADGLFNLGGECSMRIIELAERVAKRCSAVLGFTPEIITEKSLSDKTTAPLEYKIDKLKKTGFTLQGSIDTEIDNTLKLCQRTFGKNP